MSGTIKTSAKWSDQSVAVIEVGTKGSIVLSGSDHFRQKRPVYDVYSDKEIIISQDSLAYSFKMELVEQAQMGVKAGTIKRLADLLKISIKEAVEFFHFSDRTFRNYVKNEQLLDSDSSEKVLKMFSLYLYGQKVFGQQDEFVSWLFNPSFGLRNKVPAHLLMSSSGIDLVYSEISRIDRGDIS